MKTILTNEQKNAIENRELRNAAEALVVRIGVRSDLGGSRCLTDAVILYGTELCTKFCEIYRIIGLYRNKKQKSVMREIDYAIKQAYDIRTNLSKMMGISIPDEIHGSLVIAYLGSVLRNPALDRSDDAAEA